MTNKDEVWYLLEERQFSLESPPRVLYIRHMHGGQVAALMMELLSQVELFTPCG